MKSVLLSKAALSLVSSASSSSSTTGIISSKQLLPQRVRDLLDEQQTFFMETLQKTVNEAKVTCDIDFTDFTLPFADSTVVDENTDTTQPDPNAMAFDFLALLQHYANLFPQTCSETDEATFRAAIDEFQLCSSFDIEGVVESFGDALIGSVMECTMSIVPMLQTMEALSDLILPEQCRNALLGKNPLGDIIRNTILYPDKILSCLTEFSENIPSCTIEEWPVPLVGPILSQASCFLGELNKFVYGMSDHNLKLLDGCLPEIDEANNAIKCDSYCLDLEGTEVMLNFPFSDIAQSTARSEGLEDVEPRFEAFAEQCLPEQWEGWSYHSNDYTVVSVKLYPDPNVAADPDAGNDNDADSDTDQTDKSLTSSSSTTDDNSDGDDRFAMGFAAGFVMGLFTAAIMCVMVKCCQCMRKRKQHDSSSTAVNNNKEPDSDTGSSSGDDDGETSDGPDIFEDVTHTLS